MENLFATMISDQKTKVADETAQRDAEIAELNDQMTQTRADIAQLREQRTERNAEIATQFKK